MHKININEIQKYTHQINRNKYHICIEVKDIRNPFDYEIKAYRQYFIKKKKQIIGIDPYFWSNQNKSVLNSEECSDEEMIYILEKMIREEI